MRPSSIEKRAAALASAGQAFLASGYETASMDAIAQDSGVSKQTLYSHFGSKRELFLEFVRSKTMTAGNPVLDSPPTVDSSTDPFALLESTLVLQLSIVLTPEILDVRRLVIAESSTFPELAAAVYDHGPRRAIASLAHTLSEFDRVGTLTVPTPTVSATQLNWLVMGEPINRAMLLGNEAAAMTEDEIRAQVTSALDLLLPSLTPT